MRQTVCWRRHVTVLLFQLLSPLFCCPKGVRKTWHWPAMSLSQSSSHPLSVTLMLKAVFVSGSWHTPVSWSSNQPTHTLFCSPLGWDMMVALVMFSSFVFIDHCSKQVSVWSTWVLWEPRHLILCCLGSFVIAALGWLCYHQDMKKTGRVVTANSLLFVQ